VTPQVQPGTPLVVPQRGQKTRLTGLARLITDPGAPLVGDQGGAILSDVGGGILSDMGGGLISNNGGSVLGKFRLRRLLQAGLGVYGLTDAEVRLYDAAGRLLVDEAGQPLTASTGADATYTLEAVLPATNLVARIRLWNGGELSAIVAGNGAQQAAVDLTTATSLGASYVLGLAQGQQAILDKLPATENERLSRELDAVRGFAQSAFRHDAATLEAITAKLRQRVPAVDRVAEDVRALLLGQAKLGAGLRATDVPLAGPLLLTVSRSGGLLIGEQLPGRIRELKPDGTLEMLLDKTHGLVKNNALTMSSLAEGADGAWYYVARSLNRVYRIPRTGDVQPVLGSGKEGYDPPGAPLTMAVVPRCLAFGSDGTLWVGEEGRKSGKSGRLLALRPDGQVEAFEVAESTCSFNSLAVGPDGEVYAALARLDTGLVNLWRRGRDGRWERLAEGLRAEKWGGLCITATGTLLVSEGGRGRVLALQADDTLAPYGGQQPGPQIPGGLAAHPDGTVFISDLATNVVWAQRGDAPPRTVAGTAAVFQAGDTQAFAINMPIGLTSDGQGHLYIADSGSNTVKRFDGKALTVFAGGGEALGDGGPATRARLQSPRGVVWQDGSLYVLEDGRIRRIGADGASETLHSSGLVARDYWGLALGPDGQPWWSRFARGNLARATSGDTAAAAAGGAGGKNVGELMARLTSTHETDPAKLRLVMPSGIVRGPDGHMVFCDAIDGRIYRLRPNGQKSGTVELVAGIGLMAYMAGAEGIKAAGGLPSEEGIQAREAMLSVPLGLAYDAQGNLYVAEGGDRNLDALASLMSDDMPLDPALLPGLPPRVRRIAPDGTITTVAGPGGKFFTSTEGDDALYVPSSLAVTPDGRLAIGDIGSNLVRILPAGRY
jgi:sugar lactone lactonase YvrE